MSLANGNRSYSRLGRRPTTAAANARARTPACAHCSAMGTAVVAGPVSPSGSGRRRRAPRCGCRRHPGPAGAHPASVRLRLLPPVAQRVLTAQPRDRRKLLVAPVGWWPPSNPARFSPLAGGQRAGGSKDGFLRDGDHGCVPLDRWLCCARRFHPPIAVALARDSGAGRSIMLARRASPVCGPRRYARATMSTTPAPDDAEGFHVVVAEDGSLRAPAGSIVMIESRRTSVAQAGAAAKQLPGRLSALAQTPGGFQGFAMIAAATRSRGRLCSNQAWPTRSSWLWGRCCPPPSSPWHPSWAARHYLAERLRSGHR
jgi:hypothetical protein